MSYRRLNNLFERSGIGDYENTGDWSWEFYPPPYDFLAPADSVAMPPWVIGGDRGMGCAGECGCKGTCNGLGRMGMGLFDSTDFSTWGIGEYAAIGLGLYLLYSLFSDTKAVAGSVKKRYRRSQSASRRKKQLQQELSGL
jgi:hypothetical protein